MQEYLEDFSYWRNACRITASKFGKAYAGLSKGFFVFPEVSKTYLIKLLETT